MADGLSIALLLTMLTMFERRQPQLIADQRRSIVRTQSTAVDSISENATEI